MKNNFLCGVVLLSCLFDIEAAHVAIKTKTVPPLDQRLLRACTRNNIEKVRALLAAGTSVNASDIDGCTALMWSVTAHHVALVHLLLDKGALVAYQDKYGLTALLTAVMRGSIEMVKTLIAAGANVNDSLNGWTALMIAAEDGHCDMVKLLVASGADVSSEFEQEGKKKTVYDYARGNLKILRAISEGLEEYAKRLQASQ